MEDLEELKEDLVKCGHRDHTVEKIEPMAVQRVIENEVFEHLKKPPEVKTEKLVYSLKYFKEINELKKLVHSV